MSEAREYCCAHCGGTFVSAWDDEDANQEAVEQWGRRGDDPSMVVVCDDCYREFMAWRETEKQP